MMQRLETAEQEAEAAECKAKDFGIKYTAAEARSWALLLERDRLGSELLAARAQLQAAAQNSERLGAMFESTRAAHEAAVLDSQQVTDKPSGCRVRRKEMGFRVQDLGSALRTDSAYGAPCTSVSYSTCVPRLP